MSLEVVPNRRGSSAPFNTKTVFSKDFVLLHTADLRQAQQRNQQYYQPPPQQQQQAYSGSPGLGARKFVPHNLPQRDIETIKEDPNMPEGDILVSHSEVLAERNCTVCSKRTLSLFLEGRVLFLRFCAVTAGVVSVCFPRFQATKKLQSLQNQLNGHRLRLSVTAGDLIGKSVCFFPPTSNVKNVTIGITFFFGPLAS